jgi:hypothetical protein
MCVCVCFTRSCSSTLSDSVLTLLLCITFRHHLCVSHLCVSLLSAICVRVRVLCCMCEPFVYVCLYLHVPPCTSVYAHMHVSEWI